jgi:hypothetical protein
MKRSRGKDEQEGGKEDYSGQKMMRSCGKDEPEGE